MSDPLAKLDGPRGDLYVQLRKHLLAQGTDVKEVVLMRYVVFKRLRRSLTSEKASGFATVTPRKAYLLLVLGIDPNTVALENGFTRDIRKVGHWGVGDLEVTLRRRGDIQKAKSLIQASYEAS